MTSSVDGLVSGMQTSQVIAQLMQAEAQPQNALKAKVTAEQKIITAYQAVNTKVTALKSAADLLTQPSTWTSVKATSSSPSVVATAGSGAAAGSFTFDVKSVAKAQISTAVIVDPTAPVTTNGTLTLTGAGLTDPLSISVDPDNDTPEGVAAAINDAATAAGANVRASVLTTDQGTVLQLTGTKLGAANAFDLQGLANTLNPVTTASDAQIQVGGAAAGSYTFTSSTNTFTTALPGVTFTVSKLEDNVTIGTAADAGSLADKMQAMVDAANGALGEISKNASYDPASHTGGPLLSDFNVRQLQMNTLSAVSNGDSTYGSFSQLGMSLDSSGKLQFDRTKFLAAYAADPAATQSAVSDGVAGSLKTLATGATDPVDGSLTVAVQNGNAQITDLNKYISDWDVRLTDRKNALQTQFANLEVALGKLKDQSSWLSSQIASLPRG